MNKLTATANLFGIKTSLRKAGVPVDGLLSKLTNLISYNLQYELILVKRYLYERRS